MKYSVTLSLTVALVACSQMESLALAEAAPKQPNIVLLISDDDDYEHFGFMGSKIAHTPTLDKLAAAGTLFTTAHCPAPLCRPSLASMLSGRLPHQHGIYSNYLDKRGIGSDRTKLNPNGSLANRLKDAGYATYASGKYWEGDPRAMGFTHGTVDVTFKGFSQFVRKGQDELFQFIDEQHQTKPMFIWWAPLVPHLPHNPPSKYMDRFSDVEIPIPSFYKGDREKYVAGMRKFYAMGTWFDDGVAQLIKKLKAAGEYENTLFLFYVDNGWAIGMPAKNSPSEKGLRTPMFVTWPGKVPASKRIDSLNYVLDLHATALDYAGLEVPADITSKSLRSQIDGKTGKPHEILFGAVYSHNAWAGDPSVKRSAERDMLAIYARTDQWKYVNHTQDINQKNVRLVNVNLPLTEPYYRQKGEQYLFDLHADPYEQNNLAGQSSQKERVVELRRQTLDWWKRTGGGPLEVAELNPSATSKNASGAEPRAEEDFFNGKDLSGWKAKDMSFWSVKDGAIVGTAGKKPIPGNQFLWHKTPVSDFYLSLKVKHAPYSANAGIQFRSAQFKNGAAHGYQADVGEGWWGTLFHEHGRKILARSADVGERNIRREDWNHYEILAVGQRIWLAINGKITVALRDRFGESDGHIAVQIHGGPPQTVAYKDFKLIHSPKVELLGMGEEALNRLLVDALKEGMPIPKQKKVRNPEKEKADNASKQNKPNIIVIMADDMGYAGPSCFGNPYFKTPEMDRLAADGMKFTDFHSSGAVCTPTRAGLLTGRYQQRTGVETIIFPWAHHPEFVNGLQPSEVTFAEVMKSAGYATGMVGKWHLGYAKEFPKSEYHPLDHGFDYFRGYLSGNIDFVSHVGDHMKHDWWHGRKETREEGYTTHLINKYALEFIQQNRERPFCLYVAHEAIHNPIQVPGDPVRRTEEKWTRWNWRQKSEAERVEKYKGMTLPMDEGIGQIRRALDKLGLARKTFILFFSDNGDAPAAPGGSPTLRGHKGQLYEGGHRVPAIAVWPGKIKAGSHSDQTAISIDVMPTILSLADAKPSKGHQLDGMDLSPTLLDQKPLPDRPFFWAHQRGGRTRAMRNGPWKMVVSFRGRGPTTRANANIELFNLDDDLGEKTNVAAQHPERAAAMYEELNAWYADTQKTATPQPSQLAKKPRSEELFFNGKDLSGWKGNDGYWSVKDGAIVGHSDKNVPKNEFIWSGVEVKDFYLAVDVKLTPDARNAGIQFRSKPINDHGQAHGYQADVGGGVWGKLYHEHGRGKLDWNNNAAGAVKPGDWNRYEILAVGHKIWTAINGKLCVALEDPKGELSGKISFQVHGGPAQTVLYRNPTLIHNPKIALEKQTEKQLLAALPKKKAEAPKPAPKKPISTPLPRWTKLIVAVDPGSQGEAWAKPAFDHAKWKTMKVPGHFEKAGLPDHDGVVWFRKTIELSAEQAKAKAVLFLGQIDDMDVTWVNGTRVGGYENPGHHYTLRKYPVPAGLLKTGKNTIAVRVMDHGAPGGIAGKPEQLALQLGKEIISLANLWHFAPGANLNALNKHAALVGLKLTKTAQPARPAASLDPALLRPLTKPAAPVPAFTNGFTLKGNQSIVIVGGANAAECQRYGYLETLLAFANPGQQLYVRNMAWAADTVYTQQRPRNFFAANKPSYGEKDRRLAMAADVLFVWFGQMESLEGTSRLDDFTKAYIEMLTQFAGYTGRLVLVTPVPSEDPLDLGLKVKDRNATLAKYALAIRQIARDRNLPLVDLFAALRGKAVTSDGLLLSGKGHQLAAQAFANQLGFSPKLSTNTEPLRQAILKKNALWQQYWFPPNWAFLYGNRQQTASSRSHLNRSYRWFPGEIQSILPELKQLENAITKEAARARQ